VPLVEIFVLALASALWPALVAVVVVALATPEPVRLLTPFLAGALLTTVTIGMVLVTLFQGSSLETRSRSTVDPVVDIVAGVAALLLGLIVSRRGSSSSGAPKRDKESGTPGWSERMLTRGATLAFVVGIVLNVIPGVLPFVALKNIAELDYSTAATFALVVGFYVVMLLPAELPLLAYLVAPERSAAAVARFNAWLGRSMRRIVVAVLYAAGLYLIVRGLLSLR